MTAIQRFCGHMAFVPGSQGVVYPFITLLFSLALILIGLPAISGAQQACMPDGDVDQNGTVTAADALLVFQQALGLPRLSMCQQSIADVFPQPTSSDGSITASDALCVLRAVLTLPSCLDNMQPSNQPPVVSAQADPSSAEAGTIVILSASARDPDGAVPEYLADASSDTDDTIATYGWEQTDGPTVALAGANSPTAMFTAPHVTATESLTFRITVSDHEGALGRNTVSVTVTTSASSGMISGTLIVGEGSFSDGDTKDTFDPVLENNSLQGQRIGLTPPVTVAGHVNHFDDEVDVYNVRLPASTDIVLKTGDWPDADLDLYLAHTSGEIIDASLGYGRFEFIGTGSRSEEDLAAMIRQEIFDMMEEDLPAIGQEDFFDIVEEDLSAMRQEDIASAVGEEFLVMVRAASGASNYVLSFRTFESRTFNEAFNSGMQLSADVEPDDIVVEFEEGLDETRRNSLVRSVAGNVSGIVAGDVQLVEQVVSPSGPVLLKFQDNFAARHSLAELDSRPGDSGIGPLHHATAEAARTARMLHTIKRLGFNPDVSYAGPNYLLHSHKGHLLVPNDPLYVSQWHYPHINLPEAWNITTGSDDIVVAVIDSGVAFHPDLSSRLVDGFDFVSNAHTAGDGDGIDPYPIEPTGSKTNFHGLHVAGTIGAETDNGEGVAGVTWQGKIMPLRVLDVHDSGTDFDITQAILYAAGLPNSSRTLPAGGRADIINMSLGPRNERCASLRPVGGIRRTAIERALEAGVHVVIAAGNDNCDVPTPMSHIDGVITVGNVDEDNRKARRSNYGRLIDVVAPGQLVLSTMIDDSNLPSWGSNYVFYSGTSMAAPHVSGVLALMLAVNPDLRPVDFNRLLAGTYRDLHGELGPITQDLGLPGRDDTFGHGLIDALKAVQNARRAIPFIKPGQGPLLVVSPRTLDFGDIRTEQPIYVWNGGGGGQLAIGRVATDASWLTAEYHAQRFPRSITVRIDRMALTPGIHYGHVSMRSNAGSRTIPVSVEVKNPGGNAGTIYVILAEPGNWEPVAQATTDAGLNYEYYMPVVPEGSYIVIAGTDRDNDRFICDPGEVCGVWPAIDSHETVYVRGNLKSIDIPVSLDLITASGESPFAEGIRRLIEQEECLPVKCVTFPCPCILEESLR